MLVDIYLLDYNFGGIIKEFSLYLFKIFNLEN